MATFTVVIWVLSLILLLSLITLDTSEEWKPFVLVFSFVSLGVSLALAEALTYDMTDSTVHVLRGPLKFYLLWGMVSFGVHSLAVALGHRKTQRPPYGSPTRRRQGSGITVVGGIGFLSAVLGIVSFYLQHVKPNGGWLPWV
jgi:hypothetical protein